ncbi:MAG: Bax inhibitor-1/YccA family protein [Candidatus Adiutrix intracellularis]|jgi:FtsH-binding integral membrane protein|nr:Bax inhibitor-1/YccA family protein [Candidatus Adiutrix intracellularis]
MQDFTHYTPNTPRLEVTGRTNISSETLFFQHVYIWMFIGLALTALTGYTIASSEAWLTFLSGNSFILIWVTLLQLGLVFYLSARIDQMSAATARGIFMLYSALTGATFSALLLVYPSLAFVKTFICTAGIYGAMAVYGLVTKKSLEAWGGFLFMGVIGLVLASLVNMFMQSGPFDLTICVIGVFVFAGLTAYDHQKLRVRHHVLTKGVTGFELAEQESRVVIIGALQLYLDFINIFLFLLRLFGSRRD